MSPTSDARASGPNEGRNRFGERLIVGYKLAKAAVELLLCALLVCLGSAGVADGVRASAAMLRHHAVEAWSIELSERLVNVATARHVMVVALALLLDGLFSLFEGWALHRRYRFGRWLVVGATSSLLPFEIASLFRHLRPGRAALLFVNLLIVAYLLWRGHTAPPDSK